MRKVFFITDFLPTEIVGGAELTLDAIFQAAPKGYQTFYIKSNQLTPALLETLKGNHLVLGNFTQINKAALQHLIVLAQKKEIVYSVIEFDYKYCEARNEKVHNHVFFQNNIFGFCKCGNGPLAAFVFELFKAAKHVYFMSSKQKELYFKRIPTTQAIAEKFLIQYSTWSKEDLELIFTLTDKEKNDSWAIVESSNWLKGQENAVRYAKEKGLKYNLIKSNNYKEFLNVLAGHKGLIFHPNAWDTCPRLVIEAKLMGLEVDINSNVQIQEDLTFLNKKLLIDMVTKNASEWWINEFSHQEGGTLG